MDSAKTASARRRVQTAALLGAVSALAGVPLGAPTPRHDGCPRCIKGKLIGASGLRYCQRCAFIEPAKEPR